RLAGLPVERSSITVTSWPARISASTRWLPMNPAPPVTMNRIFAGASLGLDFDSVLTRHRNMAIYDAPHHDYSGGMAKICLISAPDRRRNRRPREDRPHP